MTTKWRVALSLERLYQEINERSPRRSRESDGSIGDPAHAARVSDHNPCLCCRVVLARDFTHNPGPRGDFDAHAFADWLRERVERGDESRVRYVISAGRIFSGPGQKFPPGVWRPYAGANRHDRHVHVSVAHPAAVFDDPAPWGWWPPAPAPA